MAVKEEMGENRACMINVATVNVTSRHYRLCGVYEQVVDINDRLSRPIMAAINRA